MYTYVYIYIYLYIYVCIYVCICIMMFIPHLHERVFRQALSSLFCLINLNSLEKSSFGCFPPFGIPFFQNKLTF